MTDSAMALLRNWVRGRFELLSSRVYRKKMRPEVVDLGGKFFCLREPGTLWLEVPRYHLDAPSETWMCPFQILNLFLGHPS